MINNKKKIKENTKLVKFDEALELVKSEVDNSLSTSPLIIRNYTKHLTESKGKFIRAISVLIAAEDNDGFIHPNAIKVAAGIEILHLATLVHDDVIDNADLRRGDVTLQKKYGKKTAVICGDYLFCIAINLATDISNKEDYLDLDMPNYMGKVCLGELNQHLNNGNLNLSMYQYLKIISGKTAALFEASFYAGAIFSGCKEAECKRYRQLGHYIGMIFQLIDDCIDFENTVDVAKKPVQSDYEQGVITLPLIKALEDISDFKEKASSNQVSREEINEAVAKADGLKFTHRLVRKYHTKSMNIINGLELTESKKAKLIAILNKAAHLS
jgi:heptaprenyl diphosphate synthase